MYLEGINLRVEAQSCAAWPRDCQPRQPGAGGLGSRCQLATELPWPGAVRRKSRVWADSEAGVDLNQQHLPCQGPRHCVLHHPEAPAPKTYLEGPSCHSSPEGSAWDCGMRKIYAQTDWYSEHGERQLSQNKAGML